MKLLIALATIIAISTPTYALTLQQAQNEVAGYFCKGSICTKTFDIKTTVAPTIVRQDDGDETYHRVTIPPNLCEQGRKWACDNQYWKAEDTGAGQSTHSFGGGIVNGKQCVSKELVYNGPNTSRDMAWSVNTGTC